MVTVGELTAPFPNYLVPVLPYGDGVCDICWTSVVGYPTCWECKKLVREFGSARADTVVPIALAVKADDPRAGLNGQFAYELGAYKNDRVRVTREHLTLRLAALLWRFLLSHERCVARAARTPGFDIVATVPSTRGRFGVHPMEQIVGDLLGVTRHRFRRCVVNPADVVSGRDVRGDRFRCEGDIDGSSVLLIDDQWTTGNHAQSAAHALKQAGATRVGVVVLGRRFAPSWDGPNSDCRRYFDLARKRPFSWESCCLDQN